MALGHGGYREGAGRKPGPQEPPDPERADARKNYEVERARHEAIKADEREFEFAIKRGEYLPRDAQRQANATLLAVLTQSLRALPDNLERKLNLSPEACEMVGVEIDNALAEVAAGMKKMVLDE